MNLLTGDDGRDRLYGGDRPQDRIGLVGRAGELVGGDSDDREHGRRHAEEDVLDEREALVVRVQDGDRRHDQKRRHDKGKRHRERSRPPALEVAEPHRQLGGERPRHRLRDGEALLVLVLGVPAAIFDEVAVHVAGERDRPTEAPGAELGEVADEPRQGPLLAR